MSEIDHAISESTGLTFRNLSTASIGGGCINQASRITGEDGRQYFIKKNNPSFLPFFEAEAQALIEIKKTKTVRVPEVIAHGLESEQAYLVLEYIEEEKFFHWAGRTRQQPARLRVKKPFWGWCMDNCIGATPQPNPRSDDWVSFYRDHRLAHQFELAAHKGRKFEGSQTLLDSLHSFFSNYSPHPSLLHGDLWGGNASCDKFGSPFIFDPASYYGDREADLAFTYMFGGFSSAFYDAYENVYPLDPGFDQRKSVYNLYHELNHFNLFGGGYASSAQSSINELIHC